MVARTSCALLFVAGALSVSECRAQDVEDRGSTIVDPNLEKLFPCVPPELRGGLFRPGSSASDPATTLDPEGFVARVQLRRGLCDWSQLEFNGRDVDVNSVRIFGFQRVVGKSLDLVIKDRKRLNQIKASLDTNNVFRSAISDLARGSVWARGACILGVVAVEVKDRPGIIIGVSEGSYTLGACYGPNSQWFYAPRFTNVLNAVLLKETGVGLNDKVRRSLAGRHYFLDSGDNSDSDDLDKRDRGRKS